MSEGTLTDYLRNNIEYIDTRFIVYCAIQILEVLIEIMQKNLLHNDLKPDNIGVLIEGGLIFLKILDFGSSRTTEESLHSSSVIFFTKSYSSLEIHLGD